MTKQDAVFHDMRESIKWVQRARPMIENLLKCRIIRIEDPANTDEVRLTVDLRCGLDYLGEHDSGFVYGIASRWQGLAPGQMLYNTFTIRKKRESGARTEYEKLCTAMERGCLCPSLTIQGYYSIEEDRLLSFAIAKTEDIIRMIRDGQCDENRTGADKRGQAEFYVVSWDKMQAMGYRVIRWNWWEEKAA